MKKVKFDNLTYVVLTWKDILEDVKELGRKIKSSEKVDGIVGILRGGCIPAVLLSDFLNVKKVFAIGCKQYFGIYERKKLEVYQSIQHLEGNILIVDDVSDTGSTLNFVKKYVEEKTKGKILTAALHVKPHSLFIPHFYVKIYDGWICYPWDKEEFKRNFIEKYGKETFSKIFKDF
ncbi:MAG TPA: phosphoribosyltransferase [Candidatus Pacearchaeota archaeon]|nr:phosphoribosyltransferase [Candidatus Pacearchaeota archaeon]